MDYKKTLHIYNLSLYTLPLFSVCLVFTGFAVLFMFTFK